jgi:hypothetical protein
MNSATLLPVNKIANVSAIQILSSINEELVYIKNLVSKGLLNDTIIFELEQKAYKQVLSGYQVFLLSI